MAFLERVKGGISTLSDLVTISTFFAVSFGGIVAMVLGVVGWLTSVPWFFILSLSPMGAAGLLLCLHLWRGLSDLKTVEALAQDWRDLDSYMVWQAACLWIGVPPVPRIDEKHKAYPTLQKIKASLVSHQISSVYGDTGMTARVTRQELIKFAEARGERPKFLFPNPQAPQSLPGSKRDP